MTGFTQTLAASLPAGLELSEVQLARLEHHFTLLLNWNRRLNLTRITKLEVAVDRHYGESLFVATMLPRHGFTLVDVGSGAGFPGIPIAVALPWAAVTLVESDQRKAVFLREASSGLRNVAVQSKRVSDLGDHFDWLTSRAVNWTVVEPWAAGHVRHVALMTTATEARALENKGSLIVTAIGSMPGTERVVVIGDVPRETC